MYVYKYVRKYVICKLEQVTKRNEEEKKCNKKKINNRAT